jgi:hypothetical protein
MKTRPLAIVLAKPGKPVALTKAPALKPQKPRPPLDFTDRMVPDPLAGMTAPSDDVEAQGKEVVARLTDAYRAEEKRQRENVKEANATGYYRVLVFETEGQAAAFAQALGEHPKDIYLDGRKVADRFDIPLPQTEWKPKRAKIDQALVKLALPVKPQR